MAIINKNKLYCTKTIVQTRNIRRLSIMCSMMYTEQNYKKNPRKWTWHYQKTE